MHRTWATSRRSLSAAVLGMIFSLSIGCSDDGDPATDCVTDPLPLQNPRSFTLGETYYLPRLLTDTGCPDAAWEVLDAPADSENDVYQRGAPEPRFTPDVAGDYVFHAPGLDDVEHTLTVVARTPAERFRNHYLTPLQGVARVGDELWTANGPSYTVSRVLPDGAGGFVSGAGKTEVTVGSWPAAIAWRDPLTVAVVAHRGGDTVGFIDRDRGVLEDALWVGDEPSGLAISPDASTLYVSLATMREVAVVDLATRQVVDRVAVGFDPRAMVLSDDGSRLFVASYRSGDRDKDLRGTYSEADDRDIHIIDTARGEIIATVPGVSADLRAIALSSDGGQLLVAGTSSDPIPSQADPEATPFINEIVTVQVDGDLADFGTVSRRADLGRQATSLGPVVNPAGVVQSGDTLWVAAESSNLLVALDPVTLAEKSRVAVGAGARHLVALPDVAPGAVAVHCYQSFELWIVTPDGQVSQTLELTEDPRPEAIALGERIFTRPGNDFAVHHACSSCHIEAQNDGQVWRFGADLWSNVRPLQLLNATTPNGWDAYISSAANFGYAGPSSILRSPVTPDQAAALEGFLGSLIGAPAANSHTRLDGSYTASALRGKDLFEGKATCSGCHTAPLYTNRSLIAEGKSGVAADVPSLLGVYRHGVYLVDGQARTLGDAVDIALDYVSVSLDDAERGDLLAFLQQLTAKDAAPLAIWPDIDSNDAVYPSVEPYIELSEPIDDSDGRSAAEVAAEFIVLDDASGSAVPATLEITDKRITLVPDQPLTAASSYRFRILPGLPLLSGGVTDTERSSDFTTAAQATGTMADSMVMTVTLGGPMGPTPLPVSLDAITTAKDGLRFIVQPLVFGTQQRQPAWARLDGERFVMQPFALPIAPNGGVANIVDVVGSITEVDDDGMIVRIDGMLRVTGPGIDIVGVPFSITRPTAQPGPPAL